MPMLMSVLEAQSIQKSQRWKPRGAPQCSKSANLPCLQRPSDLATQRLNDPEVLSLMPAASSASCLLSSE
ncbi:hypothetical protein BGZ60DRAFT_161713 [Tricladium varicosporioides]|nr:hypothetical protein BGZ60DRAFT_161713 [Hymenoscyphus varicosporioides]